MFALGGQELLIVLAIVLVLFGGSKLPQLAKGLGEGMREFKKATREGQQEEETTKLAEVDPEGKRSATSA